MRIANALEKSQCTLEIVHIASVHNPADTPTRCQAWRVQLHRVEAMWKVWDEYVEGRISEVDMSKYGKAFREGIRHEENDKPRAEEDESSDEDEEKDDFDDLAADDSEESDE